MVVVVAVAKKRCGTDATRKRTLVEKSASAVVYIHLVFIIPPVPEVLRFVANDLFALASHR